MFRRTLIAFGAAAVLSVAGPIPMADAAQEYVLVRILPNGNEQVEQIIPVTAEDQQIQTITAAIRDELLANGRGKKINNPANRYVLYGPTEEDVPRTIDDRIWDSLVDL
jgi:hypothetical protein